MPVLLIAEVPDLSEPAYISMLDQMKPALESAPGFLFHAGGPSPDGGSRIVEVWESEELSQRWFDEVVKPNLPAGLLLVRAFHPLHRAFGAAP
jgi:heme-degrading monooxygenase HmoA